MPKKKRTRVVFLGGHSGRKGLLGVLAFPEGQSSELEYTVFYMTLDGNWSKQEFNFDVASVTYLPVAGKVPAAWWLVGKRGEVVEASAELRIEHIDTAGTGRGRHGYLAQIRLIGGALHICGYRRQVYRREGTLWKLISGDMLDTRKKGPCNGFESIDGFAPDDLYAVGDEGEIWHFDGARWTKTDSPTNQQLADVRCFGKEVWVCGDGGVILRGNKDGWEIVWSQDAPSASWWSLERLGKTIYVAGDDFLGKLEKGQIVRVNPAAKRAITTGTLHQMGGILWSIGEQHIFSFDGKQWVELICPQNA